MFSTGLHIWCTATESTPTTTHPLFQGALEMQYILITWLRALRVPLRRCHVSLSLLRLCLTAIIVRLLWEKTVLKIPLGNYSITQKLMKHVRNVCLDRLWSRPMFSFLVVQNSWVYLNQSILKLEIFIIENNTKKKKNSHPPSAVVCFISLTVAYSNRPSALLCVSLHCKMIHSFYI